MVVVSNYILFYFFYLFFVSMSESSVDTGADLSEIDARLQALQEYMRDLDTGR